ncbi:serine hydrolase [Pleurocapsa sp. PCC 7319]|uniref:serine hydrolase domain-containing protein n=1 Tax=Pleurocapsa sp. PCC 7319 TaxID=118161 RepID=UPI00034BFE3D|nr:serine hydrolase [Pleurocapsa sp. PCC 7319]
MTRLRISLTPKKIVKKAAAAAGLMVSITGVAIALNWTFLRRIITYPDNPITKVDWYQPLETVKGNPSKLPKGTSTSIPQESLKEITAYAEAANSSALLVMHRGKLIWERYWRGFTPTSTFNSMSMSKTIMALLIGVAIAEGHIESELEPVANYISEWSKDERSKITLQDLLYMHSGLRNSDNTENLGSDLVQMFASTDANAVAIKIPTVQSPKQVFDYNNANTQILGEVLERATGERYADYLSTRLWQPLEANNAKIWLDRPQGNPKPFCCLFATPRDWARVGQLLLTKGQVKGKQIIASDWLDKMIQASPLEPKYGYHVWLKARTKGKTEVYDRTASQPFLAQDTIYLDGKSRQRVYVIPSYDLVIVRIGEQPEQWDDAVIPNTLVGSLLNNQE